MEHRWSSRKPIRSSITLTLPPSEKIQANICDVSLGGLAITNLHRLIPINTVATLAFALESNGSVSYHHLHAQVAHSDAARTGFLFMEPGDETLRLLRDMLYSPASRLEASIAGRPFAA